MRGRQVAASAVSLPARDSQRSMRSPGAGRGGALGAARVLLPAPMRDSSASMSVTSASVLALFAPSVFRGAGAAATSVGSSVGNRAAVVVVGAAGGGGGDNDLDGGLDGDASGTGTGPWSRAGTAAIGIPVVAVATFDGAPASRPFGAASSGRAPGSVVAGAVAARHAAADEATPAVVTVPLCNRAVAGGVGRARSASRTVSIRAGSATAVAVEPDAGDDAASAGAASPTLATGGTTANVAAGLASAFRAARSSDTDAPASRSWVHHHSTANTASASAVAIIQPVRPLRAAAASLARGASNPLVAWVDGKPLLGALLAFLLVVSSSPSSMRSEGAWRAAALSAPGVSIRLGWRRAGGGGGSDGLKLQLLQGSGATRCARGGASARTWPGRY